MKTSLMFLMKYIFCLIETGVAVYLKSMKNLKHIYCNHTGVFEIYLKEIYFKHNGCQSVSGTHTRAGHLKFLPQLMRLAGTKVQTLKHCSMETKYGNQQIKFKP